MTLTHAPPGGHVAYYMSTTAGSGDPLFGGEAGGFVTLRHDHANEMITGKGAYNQAWA